jgi:Spy/CpxP family protein refolding chaperone
MSNRTRWAAGVLALAVASGGAYAVANEAGFRGHHGRRGLGRGLQALNLTDEQKASFRSMLQEQRQASEPQREQIRDLRQQMRQQLDTGKADPAQIGELAIQAHAVRAQLRASREQALQRFEALLTPEQKAKLDQLKQERGKRGFRRFGGERPDRTREGVPGSSF